ncbi:MAG: TrmH family RNA methyltransferase [Acidimicrobiales bacterium]
MRPLDSTGLKRLHREWRRRTSGRVALILDGVQQPYNVGAILRTATAYRVEHLWLAGATASPDAPGARKTALGSNRFLTWSAVDTGHDGVVAAHDAGFLVVGIELADGAQPLHETELGDAVCLALSHEDHGLSRNCLEACDAVAYLPQVGRIGSLNVATAAAIALYETRRQEWIRS